MVTAEAHKEICSTGSATRPGRVYRQTFYQSDAGRQGEPHPDQDGIEVTMSDAPHLHPTLSTGGIHQQLGALTARLHDS